MIDFVVHDEGDSVGVVVVEGGKLRGLVGTMDILGAVAEGRLG